VLHLALIIGGNPLETTDSNGFLFNTAPAARWLTRPIAGATQDTREDVTLPVDHKGFCVISRSYLPDIFRDRGMGRTGPLAIHHFVEIFWVLIFVAFIKGSDFRANPLGGEELSTFYLNDQRIENL